MLHEDENICLYVIDYILKGTKYEESYVTGFNYQAGFSYKDLHDVVWIEVFKNVNSFLKNIRKFIKEKGLDKYFFIKNNKNQINVFNFGLKSLYYENKKDLVTLFALKGIVRVE